jgi:hypothetical protein
MGKKKSKPTGFSDGPRRSAPHAEESDRLPALDRDAILVRQTYIEERSAFESLREGVTIRYKVPSEFDGRRAQMTEESVIIRAGKLPIWIKLAREFATRRIDPQEYIRTQFERLDSLEARITEPPQLFSERCLARWDLAVSKRGETFALALHVQKTLARDSILSVQYQYNLRGDDAYANVLLDPQLALSSLFRYCLALSIGGPRMRQVARRFEVGACIQYQRYRRHYKRYWKEFLPVGFASKSAKIYRTVYEENDGS